MEWEKKTGKYCKIMECKNSINCNTTVIVIKRKDDILMIVVSVGNKCNTTDKTHMNRREKRGRLLWHGMTKRYFITFIH